MIPVSSSYIKFDTPATSTSEVAVIIPLEFTVIEGIWVVDPYVPAVSALWALSAISNLWLAALSVVKSPESWSRADAT